MQVLTVLCHPRRTSLTAALAERFRAGLAAAGHGGELADLYAEGFDPLMLPPDEPDWDDTGKRYSAAVLAEQARIERHEAITIVFPVWWWSVPAMLKGWIDRVWNRGWAYDESRLALRRAQLRGQGLRHRDGDAARRGRAALLQHRRCAPRALARRARRCGEADRGPGARGNARPGVRARARLSRRGYSFS
jgi:putative NADPH-quinone reductase